MKKFLSSLLLFIVMANHGTAQFIDNYGISIGTSYASQSWKYKLVQVDNSHIDYKIGFMAFLSAEKKISKLFNVRMEAGYIQKGFKDNNVLTSYDGTTKPIDDKNLILHDLAVDLGLKITPFTKQFSPYLTVGIRGDYMMSYKDIEIEEVGSGVKFGAYKSFLDQFSKYNVGALIGIGVQYHGLAYLEIDYNPAFTKSYSSAMMDVRDKCWGMKLGIYINQLLRKRVD